MDRNKSEINLGGMVLFLWILLCAGTPDLYDAIMYWLTNGAIGLPK